MQEREGHGGGMSDKEVEEEEEKVCGKKKRKRLWQTKEKLILPVIAGR